MCAMHASPECDMTLPCMSAEGKTGPSSQSKNLLRHQKKPGDLVSITYITNVFNCCRSQLVADFLDEDELEEMRKSGLQVRAEYDTFGSIAAEKARQAAHTEASSSRERGHITFVPDAIITPVADSIGAPAATAPPQHPRYDTKCDFLRHLG